LECKATGLAIVATGAGDDRDAIGRDQS
jgi:hypothetical protein